jgi:threonine/homoserine/homoserine lactone efflux protein
MLRNSRMEARLLAFVGIATVITITPGADMALVTRVALGRGRTAAWLTSLGVVSGLMVWGIASAIGLSALLSASATLYTILKLAGAAYLMFLGAQALLSRAPAQESSGTGVAASALKISPRGHAGAYVQGLLNNLLNPKIGIFYTAFLPQFIAPGQPVFLTSVTLAGIHVVLGIVWLGLYATIITKAGDFFRRPTIRTAMERVTGIVLIGLGIRLVTEQR